MSTYRSTFTTRKGTGLTGWGSYCVTHWASCCVLCGIIVLLFIQSTLFSFPVALAASHDVTQQPQSLARAGVSVVRIVAVYGPQTPVIVPSLPSAAPTTTKSAATSLGNPLQTCTGLGVLVASKGSATQQNAWVLTDGSLVNKNEFTCKSLGAVSIISKQLTLNSISVYLSNAYNSTLSAAMTGDVKSVHCSDDRKCNNGVALFAFHASTLLPYAQLPNATSTSSANNAAIQLSQSSQVTNPPTATTNLQQYLTPTSSLIQTSTPDTTNNFSGFENGTPIVDQSGFLTKMYLRDADSTKVFKATNVPAFLTQQAITADPPPNDASSNWNSGISAFYQGSSHYDVAKDFFIKADNASSNQFQGAQTFVSTINTFQRTHAKTLSASSDTSENGITLPILGFVSYLLLTIVIVGVILFVLLLIFLSLLFKRGQRQRDFAEAEKQATVQARQIQDLEAQQAAAQAVPPRFQQPVPQTTPYPSQQQAAFGPVASRSSAAPVAPAQAGASYADYPTIDMEDARRNGMPYTDTTQPFSQNMQLTDKAGEPLGFEVITSTDPGIKRKYKPNEDSLFAVKGTRVMNGQMQQVGLFVVADGMGGHANGQDASRLAIQTIIDYMLPRLFHEENTNETPEKLLVDSVQQANQAVHEHNIENSADMGTTVTATLILDTTAHVANVGDSRTYLYRTAEGLSKVTRDHSVVASLVDAGIIKPDDIYTHPKRNQIYRSLGEKPFVEVDPFEVQLQPGDKMLLCSDGLWDMVRDPEIQRVLEMPITDPQQLGDNLIKAAHTGGGEDNISVIVINVVERTQPLPPELTVIYRQENVLMPQV